MNTGNKTLCDKTIVICGASSGIGRATALELAKKGCRLVLTARREEALEILAVECLLAGASAAIAVMADVSSYESVQRVCEKALELTGTIDVWINNAGIGAVGEYDKVPMDVHEQVVKTSLLGHMNGAHAVLPVFKLQGYGTIINTVSVGGWVPEPYAVSYSAAKYGLRGFSECLRCELRNTNIHVGDVFPAYIDTPGFQHGANYIGKKLKPVPPVFPASRVAKAMVRLAKRPRNNTFVGESAHVFKTMEQLSPKATRHMLTGMMENYFQRAKSAPVSPGAVFEPGEHTSVSGGWLRPGEFKRKSILAGLAAAGITGLLVASSLRRRKASSNSP